MLNKITLKLGVASLAAVALVGCDNPFSKDNGSNNAVADAAAAADPANTAADYTRGTAVHTSNVVSMAVLAEDGSAATTEQLSEMFAKYPELAGRVAQLDAVDTVTETQQGFLELNSAEGMGIALKLDGAAASVAHSSSDFKAESISYTAVDAGQSQGGSQLRFVLRSCVVEEQEQEQGQEVPDKGADKGQEQGQDKDQKAPEEKVEDCASITVILDLSMPEQKQEQGQDKGQDKGQEVPDKGQDKGQEVPDKGQEQGQEQDKGGKGAPSPAPQEPVTPPARVG